MGLLGGKDQPIGTAVDVDDLSLGDLGLFPRRTAEVEQAEAAFELAVSLGNAHSAGFVADAHLPLNQQKGRPPPP